MTEIVGTGDFKYRIVENWAKLPDGWSFKEVAAVGDIDPAIDVGADIVHDAAAECSSVISWRLLGSAVSGAVFAVFGISAAHPMFAVAAPLVGSGRQALGGWRRKNTDEARRRRS